MISERTKGRIGCAGVVAGVVTLGVGISFASNQTGFTDALMQYDWATKSLYHEAHEQMPLLVWSDYGNPGTIEEYYDDGSNRVRASIGAGLIGLANLGMAGMAVGVALEDRKNARAQNPA